MSDTQHSLFVLNPCLKSSHFNKQMEIICDYTQSLFVQNNKKGVRALLLLHIRSESFCIPRTPVTFTVSITVTGMAEPAGSNTQERRIKERSLGTPEEGECRPSLFTYVSTA